MSKSRPRVKQLLTLVLALSVGGCVTPQSLDQLDPDVLPERDCALTPIYFQGNSLLVRHDSLARLKTMARCLRSAGRSIRVSGHTDRMGSEKYRKRLGRLRALAVKRHLVRWGILPALITTTSYGRTQMRCRGDHVRCAPLNRRVEIRFH